MTLRYVVTVDRDGIDKGLTDVIRVEDTRTGRVENVPEAYLDGIVHVRHGEPRQDGARVWIECEGWSQTP